MTTEVKGITPEQLKRLQEGDWDDDYDDPSNPSCRRHLHDMDPYLSDTGESRQAVYLAEDGKWQLLADVWRGPNWRCDTLDKALDLADRYRRGKIKKPERPATDQTDRFADLANQAPSG